MLNLLTLAAPHLWVRRARTRGHIKIGGLKGNGQEQKCPKYPEWALKYSLQPQPSLEVTVAPMNSLVTTS